MDVGLLRLGVALLDVPIAHETILAAREVLLGHARTAAHELTALFRDEVWGPFTEGESDPERVESMKALSAHMQPMVVQALVTAFQRSLRGGIAGCVRVRRDTRRAIAAAEGPALAGQARSQYAGRESLRPPAPALSGSAPAAPADSAAQGGGHPCT